MSAFWKPTDQYGGRKFPEPPEEPKLCFTMNFIYVTPTKNKLHALNWAIGDGLKAFDPGSTVSCPSCC